MDKAWHDNVRATAGNIYGLWGAKSEYLPEDNETWNRLADTIKGYEDEVLFDVFISRFIFERNIYVRDKHGCLSARSITECYKISMEKAKNTYRYSPDDDYNNMIMAICKVMIWKFDHNVHPNEVLNM